MEVTAFITDKNKIKICIFNHFGYPLYNNQSEVRFGGSETQLFLISKELAKNDNFEINIITGDYDKKRKLQTYQNIKIYIFIPIKRSFKNYIIALLNLFVCLIKINPDILIQRSGGIPTAIFALYSKIFKKKYIFSIASKKDVIYGAKFGLNRRFYNFGLKNATYIVAQNKDQISDLIKWKKRRIKNIRVIKNGFIIKNQDLKKDKTILWVGRAVKEKRPDKFLDLTQQFPDERFIMICNKPQDPNFWQYWKEIYIQAQKISNLQFLEFVPFLKIDNYFQKAKVFINTSIREGFPNTFIQALKNKTPILSLNVDPDNFITKNKCGFFCNDDFDMFKKYLKLLLEENTMYNIHSINSFEYAKKNHDINKIAKEWIKLIKFLYNH